MSPEPPRPAIVSLNLGTPAVGANASAEWLLTNGLGGFAMGTAGFTAERRYHSCLTGATTPPVGRVAALKAVDEQIVVAGTGANSCVALHRLRLSAFRFVGAEPPALPDFALQSFEHDGTSCTWTYRRADADIGIVRTLRLIPGRNVCELRYSIHAPNRRCWLELRPLISLRDFHELQRERRAFNSFRVGHAESGSLTEPVRVEADGRTLFLRLDAPGLAGRFNSAHDFWRDFRYTRDLARGQDGDEDLFCPGAFVVEGGDRTRPHIRLLAGLDDDPSPVPPAIPRPVPDAAPGTPVSTSAPRQAVPVDEALSHAADQFIVRGAPGRRHAHRSVSIIAGYPWFSDWGRDTFISLPGLLLCRGRSADALATLECFGALRRRGLIPNCFDNGSGDAEYNTADASLWYIQAACAYLRESGDAEGFARVVRPACLDIIDHYRRGTDFNIRVDPADGLVGAGSSTTQLTWMDARRDGAVFTPRHGKAVEINALWCSGLAQLADAIEPDQPRTARELRQAHELAARSFKEQFWDPARRCLFDCLTPVRGEHEPTPDFRPNQIFAVSLPRSPLYPEQQRAVVDAVRTRLLTPMGLRTLDPADPRYRPRFRGNLFERDGAYHNGTVWPWLIGPYAEAVLRVGGFDAPSREEARGVLRPLEDALTGAGDHPIASVLTLAEVYDGDESPGDPRHADGCMAQAWSIAELIRVRRLIQT